MSIVATAIRGEGLVWLIGAMVCLLAAPWVQLSVSAGNGLPYNALRHHWLMPISCHFRKALLVTSLTHVSGAIASVQTFTFTFTFTFSQIFVENRDFCLSYLHSTSPLGGYPTEYWCEETRMACHAI